MQFTARRVKGERYSAVKTLRKQDPYINFELPPRRIDGDTSGKSAPRTITFNGARHMHDSAPFELWDPCENDFRYPTEKELSWIMNTYHAIAVDIAFPVLVVETHTPPDPVPLTVGCVLTHFLKPGTDIPPRPMWANAVHLSNPRLRDPAVESGTLLGAYANPSVKEMMAIVDALKTLCNFKAVNFIRPHIVVELKEDRQYEKRSLPGIVAGRPTLYHQSERDYWQTRDTPLTMTMEDCVQESECRLDRSPIPETGLG